MGGLRAFELCQGTAGILAKADLDFSSGRSASRGRAVLDHIVLIARSTRSQRQPQARITDRPIEHRARSCPLPFIHFSGIPRLPRTAFVKTLESFLRRGGSVFRVDEMAIVRLPPRDGLRLIAGRQREVTRCSASRASVS